MRFVYLVLGCLPVLGQASHPSPVTKAPGDNVTLEILANSEEARAPVSLQWEVLFPAGLMEMQGNAPEISSASKDSGKTVQCTARTSYAYVCNVSGGKKRIPDGLVATYHFKVRVTAKPGTASLKIEKAESTTADSKKFQLNDTQAIVVIR